MIGLLRLENRDNALLRRAFSFPVAAARRLNDRIQPRFRTIYDRKSTRLYGGKIEIYARFDQAGSDHAAGQAVFQPPFNIR